TSDGPDLAVVNDAALIRVSGLLPMDAPARLYQALEEGHVRMLMVDGMNADICLMIYNESLTDAQRSLQGLVGSWGAVMTSTPHVCRLSAFVADGDALMKAQSALAKKAEVVTMSYWDHILNVYVEADSRDEMIALLDDLGIL
ncbi:hypothetical protein LJC55_02260, partial [Eubacteriales bacterium OttesenSCG-928-N14]|nr:hypothetical protein [Eubacteriales bacterium OttesenSCG-928-N14]